VVTWTYDDALRLTREQRSGTNAYDVTYAYDAASNITTKLTGGVTTSYTYNNAGALTVANAGGTLTTYSWDDAGNNTVVNANGSLTTYAWDDQNRLQVLELPSGGRVTQTYDHEGRRRQREDANGTVKFIWDGKQLLAELDSGGNTLARYTSGLDEFGPTVSQRRGATSSFYLSDALGSVLRLAGANESVTDSYVLDAWGAQIAASGSTTNPHRYVGSLGYYTEAALGLDYVRSRWLRPGTGSWLSIDPILDQPPYTYAGQRPMFVVDPSGELWLLILIFGVQLYIALCVWQRLEEVKSTYPKPTDLGGYGAQATSEELHATAYCLGYKHCQLAACGDWIYYGSEIMEAIEDLFGGCHDLERRDVACNYCGAHIGWQIGRGVRKVDCWSCGRRVTSYASANQTDWSVHLRYDSRTCRLSPVMAVTPGEYYYLCRRFVWKINERHCK
jgi:RHS repeat-associated protein